MRALLAPAAVMCSAVAFGHPASPRSLPPIAINDNRAAAGSVRNGVLEVSLQASEGVWHPFGPTGPGLTVLTFGEEGNALQNPGPLIRVREGTRLLVRVRNTTKQTLVVHGLSAHRRFVMDTLVVLPGEAGKAAFTADAAGTYYYWGTTTRGGLADRHYEDATLNGALIVDARSGPPKPDRVFMVQFYVPGPLPDSTPDEPNGFFTVNGRPWPHTERLTFNQGDSVRWRVINATTHPHPMHLHGFYFRVVARGDERRDTLYWPSEERLGVTESMSEGGTMDVAWKADRPGSWLFHCHLNFHTVPNAAQGPDMKPDSVVTRAWFSTPAIHTAEHHAEKGMGGIVLGISIKPSVAWKPYTGPRDRQRLYIETDSQPTDTLRRFGYVLARDSEAAATSAIQWPGPPIILHKGRPASVTVINHSTEPSQVHWHGLELDSYYDGVAGVSGNAGMVSPVIMPRDSFEMTVTPPRAGTFMYHTHINDLRQQSHGLYGPLIVLDSAETWDPDHELIFMVATNPVDSAIMNGSASPPDLTVRAGTPYRLRLLNISLDVPDNEFWLSGRNGVLAQWTSLAKDGRDLPPWQSVTGIARRRVGIGETYDVRLTFPTPGEYVMEGRFSTGEIHSRQKVHVVK